MALERLASSQVQETQAGLGIKILFTPFALEALKMEFASNILKLKKRKHFVDVENQPLFFFDLSH